MGWRSKEGEARPAASDEIENILGASSTVRGDMKADGGFRIEGKVEGSVESKAGVVIGESGVVKGDVRGTDVVVAGHVIGNIFATGHLDIIAGGTVEGDIAAGSLRIETTGTFRGTSRMGADAGGGNSTSASERSATTTP